MRKLSFQSAAALTVFMCAAVPAAAQILTAGPEQFSVTGVATNDVLNIRADPNAGSAIIGFLAPDAVGVEILERSEDGEWGLVGLPGGNGWVSMRFLDWTENLTDGVPRPLRCLGTEPFWAFSVDGGAAQFDTPVGEGPELEVLNEGEAENGMFVFAAQGMYRVTLIAQNGICYDGMSDRRFGLQATLLYENYQLPLVFNGCCTTDAPSFGP